MLYPVRGHVYTLKAIVEDLELPDSPFLRVQVAGYEISPIQNSHFLMTDLIKDERWANSRWTFIRLTKESIPVFEFDRYENEKGITDLLIVERSRSELLEESDLKYAWIVPKMFPREQYN